MIKLNRQRIEKLDTKKMLSSIELLHEQVTEVWNLSKKISIPKTYKNIDNVIVAGMGGSALPARIIKAVFKDQIKVPVEIINDYQLPAYTNRRSLVILSSYSGGTEEVLSVAKECQLNKIKSFVVTSGGALKNMVEAGTPGFVFSTENNPCGSPRMGLGYALFSQIAVFAKLGLIKITDKDIRLAIGLLKKYSNIYGADTETNLVKQVAGTLKNKQVFFMAGEHLAGSSHVAANQMNENDKRMAVSFVVPELNHHLMEGFQLPNINQKNLFVILFNSAIYSQSIQKRMTITKEILSKNKIEWHEYNLMEKTKLNQACEALVFSSYLSFYGAILENIDPTAIPFVDLFKKKLKQ